MAVKMYSQLGPGLAERKIEATMSSAAMSMLCPEVPYKSMATHIRM